jgi:phenylpropionate dioxygenase-like ring-hydroxylating dioxygenase large terminal subunit
MDVAKGDTIDRALDDLAERLDAEETRSAPPTSFQALPKIPTGRYYDESFYALEVEGVWKRSWLIAAHESELPAEGDYILFDKLGLSVLITRGRDRTVKAFHNVCQHRGARLVTENVGKAKRFVCPYHAWTYTNEGTLVGVPESREFPCLDRAEHSLRPVRTESWAGLIFINLDDNAGPLVDELGPVADRLAGSPLVDMVVKKRITREVECNWKTMRDNFNETYHVPSVHPQSVAKWTLPNVNAITLFEQGHFEIALKRRMQPGDEFGGAKTVEGFHDMWGKAVISQDLFPNAHAVIELHTNYILLFWPLGVNRSWVEIITLGPEGDDNIEYWDAVLAGIDQVLSEDLELLSNIQRSMKGGALAGVTLGYMERGIFWYQQELDRRIGLDRIPATLRIDPVLRADRLSDEDRPD